MCNIFAVAIVITNSILTSPGDKAKVLLAQIIVTPYNSVRIFIFLNFLYLKFDKESVAKKEILHGSYLLSNLTSPRSDNKTKLYGGDIIASVIILKRLVISNNRSRLTNFSEQDIKTFTTVSIICSFMVCYFNYIILFYFRLFYLRIYAYQFGIYTLAVLIFSGFFMGLLSISQKNYFTHVKPLIIISITSPHLLQSYSKTVNNLLDTENHFVWEGVKEVI